MSGTIRTACACLAGLGLGTLLVGAVPARAQGTFIGIGHVPGDPESRGLAISADGSVVVGSNYYSGSAEHAYRWTAATGIRLITTPGFELSTTAYAVSGDGLLMGGNTNNLLDSQAWSWTEAGGAVMLFTRGTIRAASTTGDVLAGYTMDGGTHSLHAVRWTQANGVRSLEPNGQTISHSEALGLTADGALAVGQAVFPTFNTLRAFLWSGATGMQNIGSTDPAGHPSRAWAISRDGAVVVGGAQFLGMPLDAFRWTSAGGMQDLGSLSSIDDTDALAVSDDGNTIVGTCGKTLAGTLSGQAFVWHPAIGLRNLQTFLGALVPDGWTLIEARGVSADGTVITGWGRNPLNQIEGWVVRLPGGITAVTFSDVTVEAGRDYADLRWSVFLDSHARLFVLRSDAENGQYDAVSGALEGNPGSSDLTYRDTSVGASGEYYYKIGCEQAGRWTYSSTIRAVMPTAVFALLGTTPNPSPGAMTVDFLLPTSGQVQLEVLDVRGRRVLQRNLSGLGAGRHVLQLDAEQRLPAGAYLVRLSQSGRVRTAKAVVVR